MILQEAFICRLTIMFGINIMYTHLHTQRQANTHAHAHTHTHHTPHTIHTCHTPHTSHLTHWSVIPFFSLRFAWCWSAAPFFKSKPHNHKSFLVDLQIIATMIMHSILRTHWIFMCHLCILCLIICKKYMRRIKLN